MAANEQHRNEAHRAIGSYVVAFSGLVSDMRDGIEYALGNEREGADPMVARLAMGEAFANQIANAYFAICEQLAELDDEEQQVSIRLKNEVIETIKERNDLAHGDWSIGLSGVKFSDDEPRLYRTKPGRRAGAWMEMVRPVQEIDAAAEKVVFLDGDVGEFGMLCLGIHPLKNFRGLDVRVRDIFRFSKRRVLRTGRYADLDWYEDDGEIPDAD